jgi:hypothetical protein
MLKTLAGVGISMAALVAPAAAASPDEIYEFTVITDTVETPPFCRINCVFTEGPVPYKLATLTLTHAALRRHEAQASDMTNPITDDGRIVTLTFPVLPGSGGGEAYGYLSIPVTNPHCPAGYLDRLFEAFPPCSSLGHLKVDGDGYTLDLEVRGSHLGGTIDINDEQPHGVGCSIHMQGSNNNWSGTWACTFALGNGGSEHSFTALSMRVGGDVAQK